MRKVGNVVAFYTFRDFLSHHFRRPFKVKDIEFDSMEQMIMYSKARLFNDDVQAERIMATTECQKQKRLGRKVSGFVEEIWLARRPTILFIGNREKYRQNEDLLALLLLTGNNLLVEASERDRDYGVGLSEDDPRVFDPNEWLGNNLCGETLMKVRKYFQEHKDIKSMTDKAMLFGPDHPLIDAWNELLKEN